MLICRENACSDIFQLLFFYFIFYFSIYFFLSHVDFVCSMFSKIRKREMRNSAKDQYLPWHNIYTFAL